MGLFWTYTTLVVLVLRGTQAIDDGADSPAAAVHDNEDGNHTVNLHGAVQKLSDDTAANNTDDGTDSALVKKAVAAAANKYKSLEAEKKRKADLEAIIKA